MRRRDILKTMPLGLAALAGSSLAARPAQAEGASSADGNIEKNYLRTPEGQVFFWVAGRGPTLVLVHQSQNSSAEFLGLVPYLSQHFRMIAIDLPGHGQSDNPLAEPTVDDYANAVRRVLNHLGVKAAHVLGHHGGALTAMALAADEPDRFEKTILSGTGGLKSPEETEAFLNSLLATRTEISADPAAMANLWAQYVGLLSEGASIEDMLPPFMHGLDSRLRPYNALAVNLKWNRRQAVERLKGPVLLVQGELDKYVTNQETLLDIIPKSTRMTLPGCGTFMFYDKPGPCADMILRYLSG